MEKKEERDLVPVGTCRPKNAAEQTIRAALSVVLFVALGLSLHAAPQTPDGRPPRPPEGQPPFGVPFLLGDRPPPERDERGGERQDDGRTPPPKPFGATLPDLALFAALGLAGLLGVALAVLLVREATRGRREASKKLSLLATVSHEFRTPLTNLRLYAEMMAGAPSMGEAERQRYLAVISDEAERLARLVDNVLDYGRLTERRRRYALREIDLPRILRAILARFDAKAASVGVEIRLGGLPEATVRADADAVRQVVTNLVDNALKYAASGKRIVLTVGEERGVVFVDVADFGPGIPAKDAKRIFTRFFRTDSSIASGIGGAGLGLDIASGLMRGMGGTLAYRPNPAGGSIFRAAFPRPAGGGKESE